MKIAEAAKIYDLTPDTLRYYEKAGLLANVSKNKSGIRDYSKDDCKWIEFIKCMRGAGLPIEVIRKYIELFQEGNSTLKERKELLVEQRVVLIEKMNNIKITIEKLDHKIERYENLVIEKEKELLRR